MGKKKKKGPHPLPNLADYKPGLNFLKEQDGAFRLPTTVAEADRLAAKAQQPGQEEALQHWGQVKRFANQGVNYQKMCAP